MRAAQLRRLADALHHDRHQRQGAHAQEDDAPAKKGDGAGAAKAVVYLDKDRNAVVQIDRQSTSNDVSSMSMTGGTDLASGLNSRNVLAGGGRHAARQTVRKNA